MRRVAPVTLIGLLSSSCCWALALLTLSSCATMRPNKGDHPGIEDINPAAVNREFNASATRVTWALAEVMRKDPILENVMVMVDPQSNDSRPFSKGELEKLGPASSKSARARDLNYNIQAKSKDGHRIGVVVALKGESGCEVSLLYGTAGDLGMSKVLLDDTEAALNGPVKDPGLVKASVAARPPAKKKINAQ